MSEHTPFIDFEGLPAPSEGFLVTQFITVRSVARSRAFYSEVLGSGRAQGEPVHHQALQLVAAHEPGRGATPDKPNISVVDYEPGDTVSSFMNLRVADIQACYEQWSSKGAEFVTPPIDRGAEIRCYMRDPDGYLIEVGQATGVLEGNSPRSGPKISPAKATRKRGVPRRWYRPFWSFRAFPASRRRSAEVGGTDHATDCNGAMVVACPASAQAKRST